METNENALPTVRLTGQVAPAQLNQVTTPDGMAVGRPGQGGVVLNVGLDAPALDWESDHLEPGASLTHPEPEGNLALQTLSCVGNLATVSSGAALGAPGRVAGKHGAILIDMAPEALRLLRPGDRVTVDSVGVGLRLLDEPEIAVHSCSPSLLRELIRGAEDGCWEVPARHVWPARSAGAGIGMPSFAFNLDLDLRHTQPLQSTGQRVRFGDIVALEGHDHRCGREPRDGWWAFGCIAHGTSLGGGHGVGMVTLLSGPATRIRPVMNPEGSLRRMGPWRR